jgi:imidazolonepropionase-like amidohydrolase
MRLCLPVVLLLAVPPLGLAEGGEVAIRCGALLDGVHWTAVQNAVILVDGTRIKAVGPSIAIPKDARVIDLGGATVLPGLIDAHTHVLLQGDVTAEDYDPQLLKESIPFRAIRATAAARTALLSGFTTIRDLETEGAMYADADLKRAIALGYVPGPRMFVATRAMAPTGMYPLLGYSWELKVPEGVEIVDGPEAIVKAVREQVKYGADWIKYYSDHGYYMKDDVLHSHVNFTDPEAKALVEEAHRLGRKVAAHAMGWDGIDAALRAGVDSIEHGWGLDEAQMGTLISRGVYWCPTLFVGTYVAEGRSAAGAPIWTAMLRVAEKAFRRGVAKGVPIVFGTDAGGFPWSVPQSREFGVMVKWGMTPAQALQAATSCAAKLLGLSGELGTLETGRAADLIAVRGDPLKDVGELDHVGFVMKDGAVYRNDLTPH